MEVEQIIKKMEHYESERATWDSTWQECGDYGMPQNAQIKTLKGAGQAKNIDLFDTTAENANIQMASGLYSYMFPTDSKAFILKIDNNELNEIDAVKTWLDTVTNTIHIVLVQSNFRQAFFEFLKSLGCFGTACMYVEKGKSIPANFTCVHMAGIYIGVDKDGNVDTIYRKFELDARQAVQQFGKDALADCDKILEAIEKDDKARKKFEFIHAVYPRSDRDITKDDGVNMPYASVYVWRDGKKKIEEGGYPELAFMVDRFDRDSREKYGRSPMMKMMPDIKMVNRMQKTRIKGWEKKTDPPIVLPDDGSIWPLATQPGGVLYKSAGGDGPEWFEFKGDLREMEEAILSVQTKIHNGFFLDKFDVLIDKKNMTATEVMARIDQQMRFLTPIIGRLQSEFFNPMIERVYGILTRANALPEPPAEIQGQNFSVEYLGKMALALKTLETEGLSKTLIEWAPLAEIDPTFMDNLDKDKAFRESMMNNGVPATWLKSEDERDKMRAVREQQAQMAAMAEQAANAGKGYKAFSQSPEEGSPAQEMINAAA